MLASPFVAGEVTELGLAQFCYFVRPPRMFDQDAFLAAVLERAGTQAAVGRVINLPSSRTTDLYKGERRLTVAEAVKLAEEYDVPLHGPAVSAELLKPVLRVCLRYVSREDWSDQDVEQLAQDVEYGLGLLRSFAPNPPSQDALDVAARAIADRLRDRPA